MSKSLEIKLTRCLLILEEKELMECLALKPEIFTKAIGRGKGKLRAESRHNRQLKHNAKGFDQWHLYELLKANNVEIDSDTVNWIEGMNQDELKKGVIEYLLARNRHIN